MIKVTQTAGTDPLNFEVAVREGSGESRHRVTMSRETYGHLTGGKDTPDAVIEAAFRFLLDREPKDSILPRFDVTVISHYFSEFERELPRYLARRFLMRRIVPFNSFDCPGRFGAGRECEQTFTDRDDV